MEKRISVNEFFNRLTKIDSTPFYLAANGNIYVKHCIFVRSRELSSIELYNLIKQYVKGKISIHTIKSIEGKYINSSYLWLEEEEDFNYLMMNEDNVLENINLNMSPAFISVGNHANITDTQLYISGIKEDSKEVYSLLHYIFDTYCSDKCRIVIRQTKDKKYYALISFNNRYECSFANVIVKNINLVWEGKEYNLLVRPAKEKS